MEPNRNSLQGLAIKGPVFSMREWFIQTLAIRLFLRYMNYAYLFASKILKGCWSVSPTWFQPPSSRVIF